MKKIVERN